MSSVTAFSRRGVLAGLLLLFAVADAFGKATYLHVTVGSYDVISGMSEKDTRNLMIELMEIRQAIKDLTGSSVIFEPTTQILVLASQKEMNDFFPKQESGFGATLSTKWSYNTSKAGDVIALVGERLNQKRYREGVYAAFGRYLLARTVPECPAWIYDGLSEYLCTVRQKNGRLRWGETPFLEPGRTGTESKVSFSTMMVGRSSEYSEDMRRLWHYWLTDAQPRTRENVRRLFDAIRFGEPSDATTVSRIFDVQIDELQRQVVSHVKRLVDKEIEEPVATGELIRNVELKPATDAEVQVARQILAGTIKDAPARFYYDLTKFASDNPASPKPFEALARRAIEEQDEIKAAEHWQRARELGTRNPYAYLTLIRQEIGPRVGRLDLQPALLPALAANMRMTVDRCIECNPGELEAYYWMAWIEAIAPTPQESRLQVIHESKARHIYPGVYLPTAAAYLRLTKKEHAKKVLEEYLKVFHGRGNNRNAAEFLLKKVESSD